MSGFFIAVHAPGTSEDNQQGFLRSDLQQKPNPLLVHSEMVSYAEWPFVKDTWRFEKVTELSKSAWKRLIRESIRSAPFLPQRRYREIDLSFHDIPWATPKAIKGVWGPIIYCAKLLFIWSFGFRIICQVLNISFTSLIKIGR